MHTHPPAVLPGFLPCYRFLRALFLVLLLLLGACAGREALPLKIAPDRGDWEQRHEDLQQLLNWQLRGRVAVQLQKEGGSASLQWQHQANDYVIRIIGPLGRGSLELQGNRAGVSMWDSENRVMHAASAEVLLHDYLGWQVPISGLRYWIKGVPDPAAVVQAMVLDEHARIGELAQSGWHISYQRYASIGDFELPVKLELAGPNLKVKLAIREWKLGP